MYKGSLSSLRTFDGGYSTYFKENVIYGILGSDGKMYIIPSIFFKDGSVVKFIGSYSSTKELDNEIRMWKGDLYKKNNAVIWGRYAIRNGIIQINFYEQVANGLTSSQYSVTKWSGKIDNDKMIINSQTEPEAYAFPKSGCILELLPNELSVDLYTNKAWINK